MNITSINKSIILSVSYKGPSSWSGGWLNGGFTLNALNMHFGDAKAVIHVPIPYDTSPSTSPELCFTIDNQKNCSKLLQLNIEQIHTLVIKGRFFEIDSSKNVFQVDVEIKLELPKQLVMGHIYDLEITSTRRSVKARLVKEADIQLSPDQNELFQVVKGVLLPLMGLQVMNFQTELLKISDRRLPSSVIISDQTREIEVIKKEIRKIKEGPLKDLQKLEHDGVTNLAATCFNLIGTNGLINIMHSHLEALLESNISIQESKLINKNANQFKNNCLK